LKEICLNNKNKIIFFGVTEVGLKALKSFIELVEVSVVITTDSIDNKEILALASKFNIPTYTDPEFKNINFINDIKNRKIENIEVDINK